MTPKPLRFCLPLATLALSPLALAAQPAQSWFAQNGYVMPSGNRLVACHGYGCTRRLAVAMSDDWLGQARVRLDAAWASPAAERIALREIIAGYTAYLSGMIGGKPDRPRSPVQAAGAHGQMDCLDETANTTSILLVLANNGLLKHHRVDDPESRGFFLDGRYPHYTATIVETKTGSRFAVDPWAKPPGQRPDILPLTQWRQES